MLAAAFGGLSCDTIAFLADLSASNTKAWFEAHKHRYESAVVVPAIALVCDLGAKLKRLAPGIAPEPRIGGSLFRIRRDIRFSRDKSPYKTHVGIRFRDARFMKSSKCEGPVFYVEFDSRRLLLGAGVKAFEATMLAAYRAALRDRRAAETLARETAAAEADGCAIHGEILARFPPGSAQCPLALRKGLFAALEGPIPDAFRGAAFVDHCVSVFERRIGLFSWLRDCSPLRAR